MTGGIARFRAFSPWLGLWLAAPVVIGAWWLGRRSDLASPSDLAKWLAAAGSIVAVLGVLTLGRPVIRLGYRKWFRDSNTIDGGDDPPLPAQIEEERQSDLDAKALQVSGPGLVIFGTLLTRFIHDGTNVASKGLQRQRFTACRQKVAAVPWFWPAKP